MTDLTGPPWPTPADPFPVPTPTGPCAWCGEPMDWCEDPDGHAMYDRVSETTWRRRWAA